MEGETNDAYVTSFDDIETNTNDRRGSEKEMMEEEEEEDMDAFEFNLITVRK